MERQLHAVRDKRSENTLQWASDMPEFRAWRLAELHEAAKDRILWIRGPLGIGKSTMAGYFIDILKYLYPKSTVAYFFCHSHQAGLTKAHDIIRTLAYQCMENDRSVRSILEALKRKDFRITENLDPFITSRGSPGRGAAGRGWHGHGTATHGMPLAS